MTDPFDTRTRIRLCFDSLTGLSVGDALGAQFFMAGRHPTDLGSGIVPPAPWPWTDDTEMACSIAVELRDHGRIDQDRLASAFADRCEPYRGYGPGAVVVLHEIRDGRPWREAAAAVFSGSGSMGNGSAMRVPPLGAYFADSLDHAADQALRSAEVTHAHPEGVVGAIAVAVAAAFAGSARMRGERPEPVALIDAIGPYLIDGQVSRGLGRARGLLRKGAGEAAYELGNGSRVTAGDTVPFTIWCAAQFLDDYPAAVAACVEAGGDVDTTAAIVGGIVATFTGVGDRPGSRGVPLDWVANREPLPYWAAEPTG